MNTPAQRALALKKMNLAKIQFMILKQSNLIRSLLQEGKYTEAIKACNAVLTLRPNHTLFQGFKDFALYKQHLYHDADKKAASLLLRYEKASMDASTQSDMPQSPTRQRRNPFIFIRLLKLSTQNAESILSIEEALDTFAAKDNLIIQAILKQCVSNKLQRQYNKAAKACYDAIHRKQIQIEHQLTRFATPSSSSAGTPNTTERKTLWIQLDEALFLLSKYKCIATYYQILQCKIQTHPSSSTDNNNQAAVIQACKQNRAHILETTYPEMAEKIKQQIASSPFQHSTQAYHHLRQRLQALLPYSQKTQRIATSSATLRYNTNKPTTDQKSSTTTSNPAKP